MPDSSIYCEQLSIKSRVLLPRGVQLPGEESQGLQAAWGHLLLQGWPYVHINAKHVKAHCAEGVDEGLPLTGDVGHLEIQLISSEPGVFAPEAKNRPAGPCLASATAAVDRRSTVSLSPMAVSIWRNGFRYKLYIFYSQGSPMLRL